MQNFIILVICFFIALNIALGKRKAGAGAVKPRIFHGQPAYAGQFPFVGFLSYERLENCTYFLECGGAIIHKRWAITANHCWLEHFKHPVFTVGIIYELHNETRPLHRGISRDVLRFYLDQSFRWTNDHINPRTGMENTKFAIYDFALMSFEESLVYTESIQPIRLDYGFIHEIDKESYIGKDVTFMGWGLTEKLNYKLKGPRNRDPTGTQNESVILRYTDSKVVDQDDCHSWTYNRDVTTDDTLNVCVSMHDQRTGCFEDSGVPLVMEYKHRTYLIGVGSYVSTAGCGGGSTIFGKVDKVIDWIRETLAYCGDDLFDPDTYGDDEISIPFGFTPQFAPICNKQTQREWEIEEYEKEKLIQNGTTPLAKIPKVFELDEFEESKKLVLEQSRNESRQRAIKRGSVGESFITPIEPLIFR